MAFLARGGCQRSDANPVPESPIECRSHEASAVGLARRLVSDGTYRRHREIPRR